MSRPDDIQREWKHYGPVALAKIKTEIKKA